MSELNQEQQKQENQEQEQIQEQENQENQQNQEQENQQTDAKKEYAELKEKFDTLQQEYTESLKAKQEPKEKVDPATQEIDENSFEDEQWKKIIARKGYDVEELSDREIGIVKQSIIVSQNANATNKKLENRLNKMEKDGIQRSGLSSVDDEMRDKVQEYLKTMNPGIDNMQQAIEIATKAVRSDMGLKTVSGDTRIIDQPETTTVPVISSDKKFDWSVGEDAVREKMKISKEDWAKNKK